MSEHKEGDLKYYKAGDLHPGPPASGHAKAELALRFLEFHVSNTANKPLEITEENAEMLKRIVKHSWFLVDEYLTP